MEKMSKVIAYLSLGSNLGKREYFLETARKGLEAHLAIQMLQVSPIYETEPWGVTNQPLFLNQVLKIETELKAERLLKLCESLSQKIGYGARKKWGQREIDIDILLYGYKTLNGPDLYVPHPHLNERRCILQPLVDIAPSLRDPVTGKSFKSLLQELPEEPRVRLLN